MNAEGLIHLDRQRLPEAVAVLCRAFDDDPHVRYLFPEEAKRSKGLVWLMTGIVRMGFLYGEVHATEAMDGVAVWLAPGYPKVGLKQSIRTGWWSAPFVLGLSGMMRLSGFAVLERSKDRHMKAPHWFLSAIGVLPEKQGEGIASRLIRPMLPRADAEGMPCYLDSSKEGNVAIYRRYGFEVTEQIQIGKDGPPGWTMTRPGVPGPPPPYSGED
ncbi:MAG: Ribosomal protein S18 acetylase RimI [Chloroflexi bacterium]|nr:MAG: Ribosomal protein S18 acetylase RimI [Chloroflexota bacterium]